MSGRPSESLDAGGEVVCGDCHELLPGYEDGSFRLIYIDPPFNTGKRQSRRTLETVADDEAGDRTGFGGRRYRSRLLSELSYDDAFGDYLGFLAPALEQAHRLLDEQGTLYVHLDYREAHYVKLLLDEIFGRDCFLNEIIWAYDFGGRSKRRWPAKHDTILVYVKDPKRYYFDSAEVDREPYMAPGLVGAGKAARGKLPTDCYSSDTEILTAGGWRPFPDLSPDDEVGSVTASGELTFEAPKSIQRWRYSGSMCRFRSKTVDLLVTPNHRLYARRKRGSAYEFVRADSVAAAAGSRSAYWSLLNQLAWPGESGVNAFAPPTVDYRVPSQGHELPDFELGDWCELVGIYIAEGCVLRRPGRNEVHIAQRKVEGVKAIEQLLTRLTLDFHYNGRSFVICNKQLACHLEPLGKAHEKHIPRELLRLPRARLERLYAGLMLGDGHIRRRRPSDHVYVTTSSRLAGDVQELMIKLGYNASVTVRNSDHPRWRRQYAVYRRTSKESTIWPARHFSTEPYDGEVHCCTVSSGTLLVRRNGRTAVCGNCWWHTIVPTNGSEKTGYPTQKPEGILRRIVTASSAPGDRCLDFFAGSGTLGAVAQELGRDFTLIDANPEAVAVIERRLGIERSPAPTASE